MLGLLVKPERKRNIVKERCVNERNVNNKNENYNRHRLFGYAFL